MKIVRCAAIGGAILALLTVAAVAKVVPHPDVFPVQANGIRYSADGDGRRQYVVATLIATGKELWRVKVFQTRIKPWIEEDTQWVFINNLRLMGDLLFVRDGKGRCHTINIKTREIRESPCPVFNEQKILR
jgi:hypothetical protein